jgi:hypothetical protein
LFTFLSPHSYAHICTNMCIDLYIYASMTHSASVCAQNNP